MSREPPAPAPLLLLASLLTLGTMLTLFVLRPLDDNRLTSWHWVFAPADGGRLVLWLVLAVLLAHLAGAFPLRWLRRGPFLVAAAFGVAAALWPTPEVILDAARHFGQAKSIGLQGPASLLQAWGAEIPAWTDLPLVPVLYGSLFALLGEERAYLQALNSLLFAGTVLLTWRIGRTSLPGIAPRRMLPEGRPRRWRSGLQGDVSGESRCDCTCLRYWGTSRAADRSPSWTFAWSTSSYSWAMRFRSPVDAASPRASSTGRMRRAPSLVKES